MKYGRLLTYFTLVIACMAPLSRAEHYKVFVLTGQSNCLGVTNGGEDDPSIGQDAADERVRFWWSNVAGADTLIGDCGGVFAPLKEQQGGHYPGSATHWGPEIGFARILYRAGVRNFAVVKASRGGGGNGLWSKGADGHMYGQLVRTVNAATDRLKAEGHDFEVVAVLYVQGESDGAGEAKLAGQRFEELIGNLRTDLKGAARLQGVIGGIAAATTHGDTVRAGHKAVAARLSHIHYFDNTDQRTQLHDRLHFNKEAKLTVGRRFAQVVLDAGMVRRQYGKLAFIGDSITQGGNGFPGYRYRVFEHLASRGVANTAKSGYEFVGSVDGAYRGNPGPTPAVNGQEFVNRHDGHWGWRAAWSCGRVALPAGRYQRHNLGAGTLRNWTGQADVYMTADKGSLDYSGRSYVPDTVVMKIGINDLADGKPVTQLRDDIASMVDQLREANPEVRIHLCEVLYSDNVAHSLVDGLNALLPDLVTAKNLASARSPVWLIKVNEGFAPSSMTYDKTHPNALGERHVGDRIAAGLGLLEAP